MSSTIQNAYRKSGKFTEMYRFTEIFRFVEKRHVPVYSQNDIRCVRKMNEKTGTEKRDLTTKIDELNIVNNTLDKDLKKLRLKKQVFTFNQSVVVDKTYVCNYF